jgi:hypothetical protein
MSQFRAQNLTYGILSQAIETATVSKNNGDTPESVANKVFRTACEGTRRLTVEQLFTAAARLFPNMVPKAEDGVFTLQDQIIKCLALIITNDVLAFTLGKSVYFIEEAEVSAQHAMPLVDKSTPITRASDMDGITDEMRDEMSGANMTEEDIAKAAASNECGGGACKI